MKNVFDFTGKKAIVTGGASGLGRAMAEAVHDAGAAVVILDSCECGSKTALEMSASGAPVSFCKTDFTSRDDIKEKFKKAVELLGGLDIMINGASVIEKKPAEEVTAGEWDVTMSTNMVSVFMFSQLAARIFVPQGSGKIVNLTSEYAFFSGPDTAPYATSMGAVCQLTKSFSNALSYSGLRANAIAVGFMEENIDTFAGSGEESGKFRDDTMDRIPVKRLGKAEDIKGLTLFLCSEASDYVTGAVIPCDGGYQAV